MALYYRIAQKDSEDIEDKGIILKLEKGKLETIAGESSPENFGCSTDDDGNLMTSNNYRSFRLSEEEALELKGDYDSRRVFG